VPRGVVCEAVTAHFSAARMHLPIKVFDRMPVWTELPKPSFARCISPYPSSFITARFIRDRAKVHYEKHSAIAQQSNDTI